MNPETTVQPERTMSPALSKSPASMEWVRRLGGPLLTSIVLFAALVLGGLLYASGGGGARDSLVTQMLINAIIVVGMQIYIGNTGVLSFGHVGFGAIAGYTFAIFAISVERKSVTVSDAPFGLSEIQWSPLAAIVAAVVVTLAIGLVVGLGLSRTAAQSGAIAATVITLAVLFMAREVAVNWDELTGGDRAGLSFGIGDTLESRWPIYVALFASLLLARLYGTSRSGRLAAATREDNLAARAVGHNPATHQTLALVLSIVVVAVGASLRVYELGSITPKFFFFEFTLLTLTMLIVGGRNSLTGAVLGVVVITVGNEVTRYLAGPSVDSFEFVFRPGLSKLFLGLSMLLFMIVRPGGLLPDWELDSWLFSRWRRRHETKPVEAATDEDTSLGSEVLKAESITVRFGGFQALDDATLDPQPDEVTGIIGPNGAGKTTLLNVLTGVVPSTSGRFSLGSNDLSSKQTHAIAREGVVRTFQNLRLFGSLTVRENVAVAALHRSDSGDSGSQPSVEELLVAAGIWDDRDRRASELDYGTARRLELARAAATRPAFLLLDEPTSGMNEAESLAMTAQVRDLARLVGAGVVVIDHDLGFITGVCDRIYCLAQGTVVAVGTADEIQADPIVREVYLGSVADDGPGEPRDS